DPTGGGGDRTGWRDAWAVASSRPSRQRRRWNRSPTKLEPCLALQIAADRGQDSTKGLTFGQLDPNAHAVGQRGRDHAAKDRPRDEYASVQSEFGEPGPPTLELVGLFHGTPQLLGRASERILAPVGDGRSARHTVNARTS